MPLFRSRRRAKASLPIYREPPKPAAPGPGIDDVANNTQNRLSHMESNIQKLDEQLAKAKKEMQRCRPGSSTYNYYRQRATQILKQRKTLERQSSNVSNLTFNIEQVKNASGTISDAKASSELLKEQTRQLRKELQGVRIDRMDNVQDEMEDLLQDADEIQEILGRSYNTEVIDEAELDAELEGLGAADIFDNPSGGVPAYLQDSVLEPPQGSPPLPATPVPGQQQASPGQFDGPAVPASTSRDER